MLRFGEAFFTVFLCRIKAYWLATPYIQYTEALCVMKEF
jgi:hypothetical protein